MALDNLFVMLGGPATAMILFGILGLVGGVPVALVRCPILSRVHPYGR